MIRMSMTVAGVKNEVCRGVEWFGEARELQVICGIRFFFFKQKTAYEMRISDWSSDVCSSDLRRDQRRRCAARARVRRLEQGSAPQARRGRGEGRRRGRSEERRAGKECVRTGRSRGSPYH